MTDFADPALKQFVTENSEEKRLSIANNIIEKYPDRIPVLVGMGTIKNTPPIKKVKYIVPRDFTFGKFVAEIRKNMSAIHKVTGLFYFLSNNTLVPTGASMSTLYEKYKAKDGFLYITYAAENTFGS